MRLAGILLIVLTLGGCVATQSPWYWPMGGVFVAPDCSEVTPRLENDPCHSRWSTGEWQRQPALSEERPQGAGGGE
jgi:hypothetical protein